MEISKTHQNIAKAKELLLRASTNPTLGKYITKDKIDSALANIVICDSDEEFIKQVKLVVPDIDEDDQAISGMRAFQAVESKKIVFRDNCNIETIIHELVHYFSVDGKDTGILGIGDALINDDQNHDWNGLNSLHIDVLNEAMTHYITQEIVPEIKVEDAYQYGANFLKDYAEASGNMDKILDAYFNKNKGALDSIAKDVNRHGVISWHDILEISGVYQYTQMRIFRNFEKNFERCANERKRIDVLISKISQRSNEDART